MADGAGTVLWGRLLVGGGGEVSGTDGVVPTGVGVPRGTGGGADASQVVSVFVAGEANMGGDPP